MEVTKWLQHFHSSPTRVPRKPPGYAHPPSRTTYRGLVQSSLWTSVHRLESTVRYLGIEVDDALEIAEQTEI